MLRNRFEQSFSLPFSSYDSIKMNISNVKPEMPLEFVKSRDSSSQKNRNKQKVPKFARQGNPVLGI